MGGVLGSGSQPAGQWEDRVEILDPLGLPNGGKERRVRNKASLPDLPAGCQEGALATQKGVKKLSSQKQAFSL